MPTRRSSLTRKPLRKKAVATKHAGKALQVTGAEAPIRYTHPQAFGAIVAKYAGIVRSGIGNLSTRKDDEGRFLDSVSSGDSVLPMNVKKAAHAAIEALPEQASLQDAADRLALLAALEKGRQAVKDGRWKSQEEVEQLLPAWLGR